MVECKKIFFAGLDGYNKTSPKKFEMDEVLQSYKLEKKAKKIISLTPTNYKIKKLKIWNIMSDFLLVIPARYRF